MSVTRTKRARGKETGCCAVTKAVVLYGRSLIAGAVALAFVLIVEIALHAA